MQLVAVQGFALLDVCDQMNFVSAGCRMHESPALFLRWQSATEAGKAGRASVVTTWHQ